jgi:RimJ/RimL family protein N-acetyltransferase
MIEVREAPPEHYGWIAERAKMFIAPNFRAIEAVDNGRILGMVGYDSWTDNACNMHVALDSRYATRPLLREAFKVVFDRLGKGVVFGAVRSDNPHALDFDKRLGFRELTVLRDAHAKGVHIHVLEMRRENCRWLR